MLRSEAQHVQMHFNHSGTGLLMWTLQSGILTQTKTEFLTFNLCLFSVPDECYRWEVNRKRVHSPAVTLSLFKTDKNSEELISVDVVPALEVITESALWS